MKTIKYFIKLILIEIKYLLGLDRIELKDEIIEVKLIATYDYHGGKANEYQCLGYDYLYT